MPCYDHRNSPSYIREHEIHPLQERVDELARWLCATISLLDEDGFLSLPDEIRGWWDEHEKFDAVRASQEET